MGEVTTPRRPDGATRGAPSTRIGAALTRLDALLRPAARPSGLAIYGLIAALLCVAMMLVVAPDPWPAQGSRNTALEQAAIARMNGETLLTAVVTSDDAAVPVGSLTAASPSDDQGMFLFGPIIGDLLGTSDPSVMFAALWAILFGLAAAVLPWSVWRLTGSLTVALVALFAVVGTVLALQLYDLYWIVAWSVFGLLPPVLAADRMRPRSMFLVLLGACLLAGLATSIRNYAGLPVLAAALMMLLRSPWRWPGRGAVAIALCIAYVAIPVGLLGVAREARDDRLGPSSPAAQSTDAHLFWHPMYLGLGYLPNSYGITWLDEFGIDRALQEDPAALYPSARYEAVMRDLFVEIVEDDPGLVAEVTAKKLVVAVAFGATALLLLALALPSVLTRHPRRRDLRWWMLLLAPAIVLGLAQPLVGIPARVYAAGWIAAVDLLVLLAGGLIAASAESALRRGTAPATLVRSSVSTFLGGSRRVQVLTIAGALLVAALLLAGQQVRAQAADWADRTVPAVRQAP